MICQIYSSIINGRLVVLVGIPLHIEHLSIPLKLSIIVCSLISFRLYLLSISNAHFPPQSSIVVEWNFFCLVAKLAREWAMAVIISAYQ